MGYCTEEDIINLFGVNVSDTIQTELITTAIENATGWIHGILRANRVPLPNPDDYSSTIHTISIYYTASDVYGAFYNGADYEERTDMWFKKAVDLLNDYVDAYWNTCADIIDQKNHKPVKHRNVQSYNEKRGRNRWVR